MKVSGLSFSWYEYAEMGKRCNQTCIFASQGFTVHSALLQTFADLAEKIKSRATESDKTYALNAMKAVVYMNP